MRSRLKRQSILEKLWCQLSVFPRDPLKPPSFGVTCVEGKHTNTSRIPPRWQCLQCYSDDSWCLHIKEMSPSHDLISWRSPFSPQFFRTKSKRASNTWLRFLQISPQNQQVRRGTVGAEECMALPLIKVKVLLLHAPQAMLLAVGSVLTCFSTGWLITSQRNWTFPLLLNWSDHFPYKSTITACDCSRAHWYASKVSS